MMPPRPRSWEYAQGCRRRAVYKSIDECPEIRELFDLRRRPLRRKIERALFMYENLMGLPWCLNGKGQRLHHLTTLALLVENQRQFGLWD